MTNVNVEQQKMRLLIALLRREGRHSGLWFAHRLIEAADALAALSSASGDVVLRPEVLAFAHLMEQQLRANDRKSGWKGDDASDLYRRLGEESHELWKALFQTHIYGPWTSDHIGHEAADIANFAMMIADVCGALAASAREVKA